MAVKPMSLDAARRKIDVMGVGPGDVTELADIDAIQVTLDGGMRDKSITLRRWLEILEVHDMKCGVFNDEDPDLKLHLRGVFQPTSPLGIVLPDLFPEGQKLIVTMPFNFVAEDALCAVILDQINHQDPDDLLSQLTDIEGGQ